MPQEPSLSPLLIRSNRTLLPIENQGYFFTKFKRPFPVNLLKPRSVKSLSYEDAENFDEKLNSCTSLADVFELVKQSVKRFLSRHRAGLMLGLADLGMRRGYFVGAFYPADSNIIVMNRTSLQIASKSTDKRTFNAYCFHLLLHEYLHSLGYIYEDDVKTLTQEVCLQALGKAHPATIMAERGIATYFPKVRYFNTDDFEEVMDSSGLSVELVNVKTPNYIS